MLRSNKWLLALAGVLAGLLAGEAGLRLIAPQVYRRPPVWEFDPELGWRHTPGASGWLVSPEFSVEYRINAVGLRDREVVPEKAPGRQRILCFGDSFVEGWGVAQEERVSEGLQRLLGGAEVVNFGVAGYGTDQEWLLFEKMGQQYQPDWVVLFFYGNDLWTNNSRQGIGAERGFKPIFELVDGDRLRLSGVPVKKTGFWEPGTMPWRRRLESWLQQHLHLWALARKGLAPEVPAPQQQRYYQGLYGGGASEGAAQWELTGRLLEAFGRSVKGVGGRLLVVYVPALVQIEEDDWKMKRELHGLAGEYDLQKPQRQLQRLAATYQLDFLDLDTVFAAEGRSRALYFRDSHWNPAGHALAARTIASRLPSTGPGAAESRP
ncbi:MAG: SGNH/GDSL hydrolase family protein [Candidatus Latescibacteria bacterium]|nr:SGNH/GDSL hydrolase family protein [Candidatus Latescibacterota bacterium]